jgi:hypothetical protein
VAAALNLAVEPLQDAWAPRSMQLITRNPPSPESALGALVAHLRALAD